MELRSIMKVHVVPFALIMGVVYAVFGLVLGLLSFLFMGIISSTMPGAEAGIMALSGIFLIIGYPIMFFIMGFISAAILAIIYNLVAPSIGGIKVEVE